MWTRTLYALNNQIYEDNTDKNAANIRRITNDSQLETNRRLE